MIEIGFAAKLMMFTAFCLAFPACFILHLLNRSVSGSGGALTLRCTHQLCCSIHQTSFSSRNQLLEGPDVLLETFSISAAVAKYLFHAAFTKGIAGAYPRG